MYPLMNEWAKRLIYTMEYYSGIEKGNSDICNKMGENGGHYVR